MTVSRSFARKGFAWAGVLALSLAAGCSGGPTSSSSSVASSSSTAQPVAWTSAIPESHQVWRRAMTEMGPPHAGCFHTAYPATAWEEVPCGVSTKTPLAPPKLGARSGAAPMQVGNGAGDDVLTVPDPISRMEGWFPAISGATKLAGLGPGTDASGTDFSLQINTNTPTGLAPCKPNAANCTVWQQYVYSTGLLYIQHWVIHYSPTQYDCPPGYTYFNNGTAAAPENDCYSDNPPVPVPHLQITDLPHVVLEAWATNGNDMAYLFDGSQLWTFVEPSALNAYQWWKSAEFNVFGPGYGSGVVFNYGTTLGVQTRVYSNASLPPTCSSTSYTGETNNLNAVPGSCCAFSDVEHGTGIFFTQSNVPGAAPFACP